MSVRRMGQRVVQVVSAAVLLGVGSTIWSCGGRQPTGKRVIVLGVDGMDYTLTQRLMSEGRLPNLMRLAGSGGFSRLETSIPPQSPVAWSDFITGMDAGGHGIFDFLHRDPTTLVPYLSTSRTTPPAYVVGVGRWRLPLKGGGVELLRRGTPFWKVLEDRGVATTIIRMPANFPPSGMASRELSGMGTPDLQGSPGTFSYYTTALQDVTRSIHGGGVYQLERRAGGLQASLRGPPNPFLEDGDTVTVPLSVFADAVQPVAKIVLGTREVLLQEGEWSEWLPVEFELLPVVHTLYGICRIYLKRVHPEVELYVTPVNLDPVRPAMPISTPAGFAEELSRATGRYYTQGMPEETNALRSGIFTDDDFLRQSALADEENRRQYWHVLEQFDDGLLFYYFGNLDQVSHMMWRAMDPTHPAHNPETDGPYARVIEELYVSIDRLVGETVARVGDDAMVIVMSDHGFAPWTRSFNLNTWLLENGYLTLTRPARGEATLFEDVDWSRTTAYALGLNAVYLNAAGRERAGIVRPQDRDSILDELTRGLLDYVDPGTGMASVGTVYRRDDVYMAGDQRAYGPDLVVGFARGVRSSDGSAVGQIGTEIVVANTGEWSGDHLMEHRAVPGVLFTTRPLRREVTALKDLAAAIVAEFGVGVFPPRPAR